MGACSPPVKQDHPDPRVACALLLDTSYSMRGERIEHPNAGFATFCASIAEEAAAARARFHLLARPEQTQCGGRTQPGGT